MAYAYLKAFLYAGTAVGLGIDGTAQAQDVAAAAEEARSDEIVVTARRVEERLQDVPISITVFNQEQITNRNIVNPSDLSTYTPSLSANRQYGTEKSSFSIRGFVQELGTQPSVAVYFADVVAPRAQGPTTSGSGTMPGALFDLQNVQVLKGPQGTLFGRNTTGGAVLLVPQRPTDRLEGYVEGSYGNFDMKRFQAVANIPLADTFKLRLGVDRVVRDGYLHNRSGTGPADFANVNYWSARASILGELTPTLENYLVAAYNWSKTRGTLPRVTVCARNPIPNVQFLASFGCAQVDRQINQGYGYYDVDNNIPAPQVLLEQWQIINTTTWKSSESLTINNIVSYAEFREKTRINLFGDRFPIAPGVAFQLSTIEPGPTGENASQYTLTEELQFQGQLGDGRFKWQAGAYLEISNPIKNNTQLSQLILTCSDTTTFQCISPLGAFGSLSLIDQQYRFRNIAGYAQGTFKFTDQLSLTAGIRYTSDRTEAEARNATMRFIPGLPAPFVSCSKSGLPLASFNGRLACQESFFAESAKPTWMIGLDYKPNDDMLLYAKYSRGYRQGVINLLPLTTDLNTTGPEKVDTYEVGAKASFDGAISGYFNFAAFYNSFSDQQIQGNLVARPGTGVFGVNVLLNAGASRIWGFEADASLRLFEGFRLDLSYAYLNTRLLEISKPDLSTNPFYSDVFLTAALGGPLAYSPEHRLSVTGTYRLPLDEGLGRLSVAATYTYTSEQFGTHADDQFVFQVGFNPGLLPATNLVNLNLNWDSVAGLPVDFSVFATNVTNQQYHVAIGGLLGLGYDSIIIGEPRMYGARLRFRFGK